MDADVSWYESRPWMHSGSGRDSYGSKPIGDYLQSHYSAFDDFPHEFPSLSRPIPTRSTISQQSLADPSLSLTPERRIPTLVRLRQSSPGEDTCASGADKLRESRVHFDANVAVHHLSPEYSTDGTSPETSSSDPAAFSSSLQSTSLDDELASYLTASPSENTSFDGASNFSSNSKVSLNDSYFDTTQELRGTGPYSSGKLIDKVRQVSGDIAALDASNISDSNEPIAVVASDLRQSPYDAASPTMFDTSYTDSPVPPLHVLRSLPIVIERSPPLRCSPPFRPLKDFATSTDDGTVDCTGVAMLTRGAEEVGENVLARPELNTTLRVSCELAKLKAKNFDASEMLNRKVDERTKLMIDEKAYYKLNRRAPLYSDLVSLDVRKDELLNRVTEEKLAKVRPTVDAGTERTHRHEDLVTRIPDIMDFFSSDLQKEAISYSLMGVAQVQTPLQTAQSERAFDIYRHTRQWQQQ